MSRISRLADREIDLAEKDLRNGHITTHEYNERVRDIEQEAGEAENGEQCNRCGEYR